MGRPKKTPEKKKTPQRSKKLHAPDKIAEAIESVRSGRLSQRKAAKTYGIPFSTLNDKIVGKTPMEPKKVSLLFQEEEKKLVAYILDMGKSGFGMTTDDIRRTAMAIIDLRQPPENDETANMPSAAWVYRFFERHPELTLRTAMGLGKERAMVTPQAIAKWFLELRQYIVNIDPSILEDGSRMYNADESGFAFDPKGRKVVSFKGSKHVYNITSTTRTQVTVLACMSASGHYLPPMMVYPYKRLPQKDLGSGFPEAVIQASDNGWMTAAIFYTWLQDSFIPQTKHVKKPLLLLVDGHTSHTSLIETSTLCQQNGIILYCFVSHASHLIQPLDQAFFGSIKPAWAQATRQHIASCGNAVNLESFARVLKPVWDRSATPQIAAQSFRAAGIFPLDPDKVINSGKLAPCTVFREVGQVPTMPAEPVLPGLPSVSSLQNEPGPSIPTATCLSEEPGPSGLSIPTATCLSEESGPSGLSIPTATCLSEEPGPSGLSIPTATCLSEEPGPSGLSIPTATCLSEEPGPSGLSIPTDTSLSEEPGPSSLSIPTATSLSEEPGPSGISAAISCPEGPAFDPSSTLPTLTMQQLEAIKGFGLFLYDELLRKNFLRFFAVLAGSETAPSDETFKVFQEHILGIVNAFTPVATDLPQTTPSKATLTVEDILQIPKFSNTRKTKGKKLTPTIPHCISSEDFRGAIKRKIESKEKEEKKKLVNKTIREEKKKKKEEEKETNKIKKEMDKLAREQKKAELEKIKQQKKEMIKQKKEMEKVSRCRKESSSSGEEEDIESQMMIEMTQADDEDEFTLEEELPSDLCKGCHQRGDGDLLWLQCELCDGWWHKHCTHIRHELSTEELEMLQFMCRECIPVQ